MRYFGGKARTAKRLMVCMVGKIHQSGVWCEPFVGGGSVLVESPAPTRYAADANPYLVAMWREVLRGWTPPDTVSEADYVWLRANPDVFPHMTAFAGFGCSFAGKWFGGYAGRGARNYAANARNSVMRKAARMVGVTFASGDYREHTYPSGAVVYMDPPYAGTTGYAGVPGAFDTQAFWEFCRGLANRCTVFVSEYDAPDDARVVAEVPTKTDIRNRDGVRDPRVEKLFCVG